MLAWGLNLFPVDIILIWDARALPEDRSLIMTDGSGQFIVPSSETEMILKEEDRQHQGALMMHPRQRLYPEGATTLRPQRLRVILIANI